MSVVEVSLDLVPLKSAVKDLGHQLTDRISVLSLNYAGKRTRTVARRSTREQTKIKRTRVTKKIVGRSATRRSLEYRIKAADRSTTLSEFSGVRQFKNKATVSAIVWEGRKRYPASGKGRTFLAVINGKKQVVRRTSKKSYPIKVLYGPILPREMMKGQAIQDIQKSAEMNFQKEFFRLWAVANAQVKTKYGL